VDIVPFDIPADLDTPVSAFLKLAPFKTHFLLESVEGGERVARYSFLGFGDAETVRLIADEPSAPGGRASPDPSAFLGTLRAALAAAPRLAPEVAGTRFSGGLVGAVAFDATRRLERLPRAARREPREPDALFVAPRSVLVFDHVTRKAALLHAGAEVERRELRAEVVRALSAGIGKQKPSRSDANVTASLNREAFLAAVLQGKEAIRAGEVFQVVLSVRFSAAFEGDAFGIYRALRLLNPSPYSYYVRVEETEIVGSSPEALVTLQGRDAALRPIAGTRARGGDEELDLAFERELLADPKEAAEHVMLVDLARNDLGRVAIPGSIVVRPSRAIERYSHVMHMVSGVRGELAAGKDAFDLFAAAFPAGTLVGAPKVRAMQIIDELEPVSRGLYGGTVGYFGARGDMDHAITIRTLVFRGDEYSYQAGAGIVADSVPQTEHEEVLAKSGAMARALELAQEGL
jgi:anthranilate synthase component 1